jgi:hypothetical protein
MKNTIFGIICLLCSAFALNAADPSAQGTIVITEVKLDTGTTTGGFTAKGSVTANATWSASGIVLFAMKNAGGYIYTFTTTNTPPAIGDDPNTTKWTATGNLPTGTFTIWAQCAVKKFTDEQKIGTALSELVVANSSAANKETLLSVTYSASSPSRNTGNAQILGQGTFTITAPYIFQSTSKSSSAYPRWYATPKDGGLVREALIDYSQLPNNFTWSASMYVESTLDYNVILVVPVYDPAVAASTQAQGSAWKEVKKN